LQCDVDFPHEYDPNGHITLLISNTGGARQKQSYTRVEFEQTAAHMHHASDFGIPLPTNFDMNKYQKMDRADRIGYVQQKLSPDTIITYQNEIGKSISPIFGRGKKTLSVPGFAGKNKIGTELTIEMRGRDQNMLSIIREDGLHISSFSLNDEKLVQNNFWVLKNRNL
jgi:hypothetical protein